MIETWSRGDADSNMPEEILVRLSQTVRRHPWTLARASLTLDLLKQQGVLPPSTLLDAGCGWGVTTKIFEAAGYQVDGLDVSRKTLEVLVGSHPRRLIEADLTQPLPANAPTYDAVLALDVIEHIDDDKDTVAKLARLTKPGGVAILSVPALPQLFSEFDEIQGHRRRYLPETLRAAVEGSGLQITRLLWWGSWMVPVLRAQRRRRLAASPDESAAETYLRYIKVPSWPLSWILRCAFAVDHYRTVHTDTAGRGTSLFVIARRTQP